MSDVKKWWWHGKDLVPLVNALLVRGLENVRLEFDGENFYVRDVPGANEPALIVERKDEDDGPFNWVHRCPPDCP